jgi:aspartate racemase
LKTIGLLGGLTWESTLEYYRILNERTAEWAGGLHSAKIVMSSFDFEEIDRLMGSGRWEELGALVASEAKKLEAAGADFLLIGSNTVHKVCGHVEAAVSIPLLHIVDVTARAILGKGYRKVGLLGTIFTMEHDFYRHRLESMHGIETQIPCRGDRLFVNDVIDRELGFGVLKEESRQRFLEIIGHLGEMGCQGVILGCTEIPLLVKQEHTSIPLFDTTRLHAEAAVRKALE